MNFIEKIFTRSTGFDPRPLQKEVWDSFEKYNDNILAWKDGRVVGATSALAMLIIGIAYKEKLKTIGVCTNTHWHYYTLMDKVQEILKLMDDSEFLFVPSLRLNKATNQFIFDSGVTVEKGLVRGKKYDYILCDEYQPKTVEDRNLLNYMSYDARKITIE